MNSSSYFAHESAYLDPSCYVGAGTKIWHFCHIMAGAKIGQDCTLGQDVFIGKGVEVGHRVKIQNHVSIYEGVILEEDVFCGPCCVFTNVLYPRAKYPQEFYEPTLVRRGATIGANATILCGSTIGPYATIGAGAVLTRSIVPAYALMVGIPARQKGWVSQHGSPLPPPDQNGIMICPESGWRYHLLDHQVNCLDSSD
ncbi:acyltransferase [Pajaroellobacter abortibovis]|uniref:Serine acetyltransferase n=1 Tax=Pajaroellobacter abortibovis TaxID=1882918 RepID=A0A1L6MVN0_9BACT|nr:acyltransferase [Pajaroellobacter abortibovis]APR99600.1 serine acetyltransferase [Pajaroellobacter abortibovis]